jgi:hypothetical protein
MMMMPHPMVIQNERRIRTTFNDYLFNSAEVDSFFFGSARDTAIALLNELNTTLDENRKCVSAYRISGCKLCVYILLMMLIIPAFCIMCIFIHNNSKLYENIQKAQVKMRNIIDRYNAQLQQFGISCYYGEDVDSTALYTHRRNHRIMTNPFIGFMKMGVPVQMNTNINTETNVLVKEGMN